MRSSFVPPILGLLIGGIAGCSHEQTPADKTEAVAPASATPHEVMTEEDIDRTPGQSIEALLTRGFPGVETARTPKGGLSVRIHGVGSFLSSNEALITLDDEPIDLRDGATLRALNSRDIASIEVIKDAASLAMYGVRGSNGVVAIRTKAR